MTDQLAEIKARFDAIIPGPWRWFGNTATDQVYLGTVDRGRLIILSPETRTEEYVFDHDACESYTLDEARGRVGEWCPIHRWDAEPTNRACVCEDLLQFLRPHDAPLENGYRTFRSLTRGFQVHADLRFPDRSLGDRRNDHGGMMRSYRERVRYEVLGELTGGRFRRYATREENPNGNLYREDFVSIATPEAEFIEHAPEDIAWLLARVAELEQALETSERELHAALWERDS